MRMVKLLISGNSTLILLLLVQLVQAGAALAQATAEYTLFRSRYPGHSVVRENSHKEVTITVGPDDTPYSSIRQHSSVFILSEQATAFAESKEYFSAKTEFESIKAYSLVPEGDRYKSQEVRNFVRSTEISDGLYYDDMFSYSFTFPNVGKGCKLVTETSIKQKDPFYPIIHYFGGYLPCDSSVITLTVPEQIGVTYHLFGNDQNQIRFSKNTKGKKTTYQWSGSKLPAYAGDDNAPSSSYFTPHIIIHLADYQVKGKRKNLINSVDDLYAFHYSNIRHLDTIPSPELVNFADSLLYEISSDAEKAGILYRWVQKNIRYIAIEDGDNGFKPRDATLVFQRRYGDCKDKSSLLKSLFIASGLDASLAWIGTRDLPYHYSTFPSMANDDHMICIWWEAPDHPVVLDGTTRNHELYQVPAAIQGKECIADRGPSAYKLFKIPVNRPEENTIIDSIWLSPSGNKLTGTMKSVITGERRASLLSIFESLNPGKLDEQLASSIPFNSNNVLISKGTYSLGSNPLTIHCSVEIPDYVMIHDEDYYLNMNIERLFQKTSIKPEKGIPFQSNYAYRHQIRSFLHLPEGMSVQLPEPVSYTSSRFSFKSVYTRHKGDILLDTEVIINFLVLEKEELVHFKTFLAELNKAYQRSIVLKK